MFVFPRPAKAKEAVAARSAFGEAKRQRDFEDTLLAQQTEELNKARVELETWNTESGRATVTLHIKQAEMVANKPTNTLIAWIQALGRIEKAFQLVPGDMLTDLEAAWVGELRALLAAVGNKPDYEALAPAIHDLVASESRLKGILEVLEEKQRSLAHDLAQAEARLKSVKANLDRVARGEAPLMDDTLALVDLLATHNITGTPLCALLDIGPGMQAWQPALEASLGSAREALLVPKAQAEEAVRIYRSARHLSRASVVNTRRVREVGRGAKSGSIASIVVTQDPVARAFVDHLVGAVMMADTEEDLLREDRAVTRDLMNAGGMMISKLRSTILLIGKGRAETHRRRLEEELRQAEQEVQCAKRELLLLKDRILDPIVRARAIAAELKAPLKCQLQLKVSRKTIERLRKQLEEIDKSENRTLRQHVSELESSVEGLRQRRERAQKRVEEAAGTLSKHRSTYFAATVAYRREAANTAAEAHACTDAKATNRCHEIVSSMSPYLVPDGKMEDFDKALRDGLELERQLYARLPDQDRAIREEFSGYFSTFQSLAPFSAHMAPLEKIHEWMSDTRARISEIELINEQKRAQETHEAVMDTLKGQVAIGLHDGTEAISRKLRELNARLKDRTFHEGDRYSFEKKPNGRYSGLLALADLAAQPDFDLPLFARTADPASPAGRAATFIEDLIKKDDADIAAYEDPRQFFEYDLQMLGPDGKVRGSMSSRLGIGSGGENQVPYYVTIGASLASAYHAAYDDHRGMALAVFDEAFNKLDPKAIAECCRFLSDLELQVLVAAPNEKRHIFLGEFDTLVNVSRVGETVYIDCEWPKERLREALRMQDPARLGIEAFRLPDDGSPEDRDGGGRATERIADEEPAGRAKPVDTPVDEVAPV